MSLCLPNPPWTQSLTHALPPPQRAFNSMLDFQLGHSAGPMCIKPHPIFPIPITRNRCGPPHRATEAAAAHRASELPEGLVGDAGGVEAFRQQHDAVEEEK